VEPARPVPPPGVVLRLAEGQWRYGAYPLVLRVLRVRPEMSRWYDGDWLWVEGEELDAYGQPVRRLAVLVSGDVAGGDG
jgi:hypothetical protein